MPAQVKVRTSQGETVLTTPGLIRPRGQSTLVIPFCMGMGSAVPYGIDFAALNGSQTLFGTERASGRRADVLWTSRGGAAAFDVDIPRRRVAALPRPRYS